MKKIIVLLLSLTILFALTACGGDDKTTPTGESTGDTGTINATPTETDVPHTHSYSSKVTTAATCDKEGVTTFTCSCGNTYTEKIAATGQHSWSNRTTETKAYVGKDGTDKRTCSSCSASETRKTTEEALQNSFCPHYTDNLNI